MRIEVDNAIDDNPELTQKRNDKKAQALAKKARAAAEAVGDN